jgi:hypothetical protein
MAKAVTAAMLVAGTIGGSAALAAATPADSTGHKVTICHATASKTNPYVMINVDVASIVGDSGHGHSGINEGDIIPAFDIAGYHYAGHNTQLVGTPGCGLVPPTQQPPTDNNPPDNF